MTVGLVMIPIDDQVRADAARWGIAPVLSIPLVVDYERIIARHAAGRRAIVFASPRRRWSDVMELLRAAGRVMVDELALRFYQPTCTIDLRTKLSSKDDRAILYPGLTEFERGAGSKAYAVLRAVRAGVKDIEREELRAFHEDLDAQYAALVAGRAA